MIRVLPKAVFHLADISISMSILLSTVHTVRTVSTLFCCNSAALLCTSLHFSALLNSHVHPVHTVSTNSTDQVRCITRSGMNPQPACLLYSVRQQTNLSYSTSTSTTTNRRKKLPTQQASYNTALHRIALSDARHDDLQVCSLWRRTRSTVQH